MPRKTDKYQHKGDFREYFRVTLPISPAQKYSQAILAFCWVYVRKYQSHQESEVISTITAISSLAVALITSALLPVDIFLVSFMKNQNGTFKDWAENNATRLQIENTVLMGYYTLYSIILFCVFLWIPFVYFYYEEKDEDDHNRCTQIQNALKYTTGFMLVCSCLLLIGAFVPLDIPTNKNSTDLEKIKLLFQELGSSQLAYGMSALPLNLIKGTRSANYERLENTEDIEEVEQQCKDGRPLPSKDRQTLYKLEEKLRTLRRKERHLEYYEKSCWTKLCSAMRPLKQASCSPLALPFSPLAPSIALSALSIFHLALHILSHLPFLLSPFLSTLPFPVSSRPFLGCNPHHLRDLDKALHSAGINSGFIIFGTNLTNPLNMLLPVLQTVFPLDYVLITTMIMYFIFTSMAGIRNMGIWFFWIRLYKIRRGRTRPQALLFLCMILLLIVLHTSYMIYSLAPQYVMYGSQKYLMQNNMTLRTGIGNSSIFVSRDCDDNAPEDQCTVTRTYLFLHKFWFFSSTYYFGNWAFIAVFLIGLIVASCKGKKSVIEGEVEEDDSDLSDDELPHI
ncbi:hypothetical protein FKM82_011112 [Ascaphus truei]